MDTSDDPVIREVKRTYGRVEKEVKREASDVWEENWRIKEQAAEEIFRISKQPFEELGELMAPDAPGTPPIGAVDPKPTGVDFIRDFPDVSKKKKKQAAASTMTRDWLPPTLGTPGLLGMS